MTDVWSRMFEEILDAWGAHKVHVLIVNYKRYVCVCVCLIMVANLFYNVAFLWLLQNRCVGTVVI
jgi:hypothetical protein